MMNKIRLPNRHLVLGICLLGVLVLTACGLSNSPDPSITVGPQATHLPVSVATQTPVNPVAVVTIVSEEELPSSESEQPGVESASGSGYPAPENDSSSPEDQISGYPAPQAQQPTPEEGYPAPEENSPPPLKMELEATDPSTFNIASGELQLVEFFAFW